MAGVVMARPKVSMLRARLALVVFLSAVLAAPALSAKNTQPPTLTVLQFEDRSEQDEYLWLRGGLRDLFAHALAATDRVQVVASGESEAVLGEQALGRTGVVQSPTAERGEQLAKPQVILSGHYRIQEESIQIEVAISDASSKALLCRAATEGLVSDAPAMATQLTLQ